MKCLNCDDSCHTTKFCDGCRTTLCDLCWKEHNAVHFDDSNTPGHDCMCDDCIGERNEHF